MPGADTGHAPAALDIRLLPVAERQELALRCCTDLAEGQWLLLIDDQDPVALHQQLQALHPGRFSWEYVEQEAGDAWRVRITRCVQAAAAAG
ncbi:MAG: DUF2249 domain-containing protein [Gammaproteobacteria bacterium]|nr:DUF2249 domain-containing protein [Gammaproteobacteria bacterium]